MWLVGQSPQVKASVAGYFRDPGVFDTTRGGGELPGGAEGLKETGVTPAAVPDSVKQAQEVLERAPERLRHALEKVPALKALEVRIEITVTAEGLRIELLENENNSFFAVGSAQLLPETVELLGVIAKELSPLGNKVALEGHTDSRAYTAANGYKQLGALDGARQRRAPRDDGTRAPVTSDRCRSRLRGYASTLPNRFARRTQPANLHRRTKRVIGA